MTALPQDYYNGITADGNSLPTRTMTDEVCLILLDCCQSFVRTCSDLHVYDFAMGIVRTLEESLLTVVKTSDFKGGSQFYNHILFSSDNNHNKFHCKRVIGMELSTKCLRANYNLGSIVARARPQSISDRVLESQ